MRVSASGPSFFRAFKSSPGQCRGRCVVVAKGRKGRTDVRTVRRSARGGEAASGPDQGDEKGVAGKLLRSMSQAAKRGANHIIGEIGQLFLERAAAGCPQ